MAYLDLREGDIVVIRAGEDWPEHLFRVDEVYEDLVTGYSITGPLKNEYGEPDFDLILRVHSRAAN
ncbi:hypothetical protein [Falsiruegeria mediterranea]|uniref:Uncharacterized protein n=1 Tax=Falsiruegeria mediterranea M17 TaxID=1200281 RepID=A0A2R8C731_9RHOB|nr:hypothetical protein [Falsiruegeria mediterranea]SPJ28247.1 hypothetical protein TRM7615_01744 [Falsiruegeria mediterranea M17]